MTLQWLQNFTAGFLVPNKVVAAEVDIQAPYHTVVKNVSWQGDASLDWTKNASNNVWSFSGQANNLTVYATDYEVHDTFPVQSGGSTVNVHIDAACNNLSFSFPGQWKISGSVAVTAIGSGVAAKLQNLTLTMSKQVPVLRVGSCTGPTGMQAFLNGQIAQLFCHSAKGPVGSREPRYKHLSTLKRV